MNSRLGAVLAVLTLSGGVGTVMAAEVPAALVLDYSGAANPKLSSFSELADGTELALDSGATLTLLHYRTCKQIMITGGKVKVTVPRLTVEGGRKSEEAGEQCPQEVKVATAGVSGGVLMRSVAVVTVPPRLNCAVIGTRRAEVGGVEIADAGGTSLLKLAVADGKVTAPENAAPLATGVDYTLRVHGGGSEPLKTLPVTVLEEAADKLCLIRVD